MGVMGDVQYNRLGGLLDGLAGGVLAGLTSVSAYSGPIKDPLVLGLAYGTSFAVAIGYGGVLSRAWGVFVLHRTWLALRDQLPWRLMEFLDDAHRRGILRQAGGCINFGTRCCKTISPSP
jgi:hypothetical protein